MNSKMYCHKSIGIGIGNSFPKYTEGHGFKGHGH